MYKVRYIVQGIKKSKINNYDIIDDNNFNSDSLFLALDITSTYKKDNKNVTIICLDDNNNVIEKLNNKYIDRYIK